MGSTGTADDATVAKGTTAVCAEAEVGSGVASPVGVSRPQALRTKTETRARATNSSERLDMDGLLLGETVARTRCGSDFYNAKVAALVIADGRAGEEQAGHSLEEIEGRQAREGRSYRVATRVKGETSDSCDAASAGGSAGGLAGSVHL